MKTNLKQIVLIVLGVFVLFFIVWKITTYKEKTFKQITMNSSNLIRNNTTKKYLDTIIYVGLENLHVTNVNILIKKLSDQSKYDFRDVGELKAHIRYDGELYTIFVDDMSPYESIEIISHELIHLEQYRTKRLVVKSNIPTWEGVEIPLSALSYENRPWEIEAYAKQDDLKKKIEKDLY